VIDTTGGGTASGGDIDIPSILSIEETDLSLTMSAGTTGHINVCTAGGGGGMYSDQYLHEIRINSAEYVTASQMNLLGPFTCHATLKIPSGKLTVNTGISTYDKYPSGGNIVIDSIEGPGSFACTTKSSYNSGTFTATFGPIGTVTPIPSFSMGSGNASSVYLSKICTTGDILVSIPATFSGNEIDVTSQGGAITFSNRASFSGSKISLSTQGGAITFSNTVSFSNANQSTLSLNAVTGPITFPTGSSSFQSLAITCADITVNGGLSASGDIILNNTGTASISGTISSNGNFQENAGGAISTSSITAGGWIHFAGSMQLGKSMTLSAPGGITVGSQISSNASGNYDLILDAATNPISIGGDVFGLNSFTVKNASTLSLFDLVVAGGNISIPCPAVVQAGATISSDGGNIIFGSTLNPSVAGSNLTINCSRIDQFTGNGHRRYFFWRHQS
jgi:hypothetical protein